jgi:mannose-6-phosphate isomerase
VLPSGLPPVLQLTPVYLEKVWGGCRLQPDNAQPVGEAWVVAGSSVIASGPLAGASLDELAGSFPESLLGLGNPGGSTFPLLIKLLEAGQWLSVQVHPDDELARLLVGEAARGKTEAWYVIDAEAGAELLVGVVPGATFENVAAVARDARILDHLARIAVGPGDAFFIPAGTVHAIGPGVLIYEVQQMSDITYRLYDWDRPPSAGRDLHVAESMQVLERSGLLEAAPRSHEAEDKPFIECAYFELRRLTDPLYSGDTEGRSFQSLTVVAGKAVVNAGGERVALDTFETLLLPASAGRFEVTLDDGSTVLMAGLPGLANANL